MFNSSISSDENSLILSKGLAHAKPLLGPSKPLLGPSKHTNGAIGPVDKTTQITAPCGHGKAPKKTLSVIKDRQADKTKTVVIGELGDSRFVNLTNPPGLAALKLHTVMFKAAGGKVADDCWHQIGLAELRQVPGMRKLTRQDLIELLGELRRAELSFDDYEQEETVIAGLLAVSKVKFEKGPYNAPTMMRWKFDDGFREIVAKSNYWALIDRQTMFSMTSRYSLRLFEMMSLRFNLDHKHKETFTVTDLRARLGVPDGKLTTWDHFRSRALDYAIAEINQLSRFIVTAKPMTEKGQGRTIVTVELSWAEKTAPALVDTKRELERHRTGRKARRAGTVETIAERAPAFPASGSIRYTPWDSRPRETSGPAARP